MNVTGNTMEVIDWIKVLRLTRHKIGHFGDVPQANLLASWGETKPNTTNTHIHHHTTPQPFYSPFSGTTRLSQCQKRTSGLYGARED